MHIGLIFLVTNTHVFKAYKLLRSESFESEHRHAIISELVTRQFFSFATTTTRLRKIASGNRKNRKIVRPQFLDGVATTHTIKWQLQTTLWSDNMVATELSVPSSALYSISYLNIFSHKRKHFKCFFLCE